MGKARITGKIIERAEVGKPGDFDNMTDSELEAVIEDEIAEDIDRFELLFERARRKCGRPRA